MNKLAIIALVVVAALAGYAWWQQQDQDPREAAVEQVPKSEADALKAGAAATTAQSPAPEPELDPATGLVMTGDWELVRANCIACHSAKLVTQQRGTASQWLGLIRWMQATQNLHQFDPETEAKIIAYLADTYPPQADRRRAAIPPELMPPNPYSPTAQ